jgi:hypothetical protein
VLSEVRPVVILMWARSGLLRTDNEVRLMSILLKELL